MTNRLRVAIVGGGPGGLMLARLLQRRGGDVTVFERDAHAGERPQGGSLDLHAETGQRAMRLAGLEAAFQAAARPEDQGDRIYDEHGTLLFDRDGANDDRPEIDRTALRQILLDALNPGTVRWGSRIGKITPLSSSEVDVNNNGATERFDAVVGADGAWSRVRPLLTGTAPRYEGVTMVEFGYGAVTHLHVDALVGGGKMFAVGDNRVLIAQRNGHGHIRGYAGLRMPEAAARPWMATAPDGVCAMLREAFAAWAPSLTALIDVKAFIAVRPLYALPIGHGWTSRAGLTLLGDAAHLMSPFSGEGVNLALADAVDLADALASDHGWGAVEDYEAAMLARAAIAAEGASAGLNSVLSPHGVDAVLDHYRERVAARSYPTTPENT
ncbi:NAD(P)/FAD-dependent oxidoreductase [Lichenihabitans sp. Uapishka_5]|uniref:FAD-dependent oxidoreductase n=1 Tax=Lichenihabitans sp. Uapishka_5 TaxID=3037302 RepID=UPI0029E80EF3|nr:NAD(P)/FAD-dependent oxidoreductase [Lichenihabitans sp. Uapishka_5]MDX7951836.1 NAD(P)/FAD-dependent oxidoreductase [Lichenihabitans sp. Uapishka_5]